MTPRIGLPEQILELLSGSRGPLTAKQLAQKALNSTSTKDIERVTGVLGGLKTSEMVFEFPPEQIGYKTRFGLVSPLDWLAQRITTTVREAGGRITVRQVRKSLRKWEHGYFDEAIGQLINQGTLFYLTVKFKYIVLAPSDPSDYLLPRQVTALKEILERINRHRRKGLTIEELTDFLNGSDRTEVSEVGEAPQLSEELLREWYKKDLPRRGGVTFVPIPWTWSHYESWCASNKANPDLAQFQAFMRRLQQAGKIEFISHSMTHSLSQREAELSFRGQHGEVLYYWQWR